MIMFLHKSSSNCNLICGTRCCSKEMTMAIEICWLDDLIKAQATARKTNKPILVDFYNTQ
jgi:hypothetical protein